MTCIEYWVAVLQLTYVKQRIVNHILIFFSKYSPVACVQILVIFSVLPSLHSNDCSQP